MAVSGGEYRSGYAALAGRSNVGKSTLLNAIVGEKIAIVTPVPQTTRRRVLGIRTDSDAQLILVDSPGLHQPTRLLNQRMVEVARRAMAQAEVIIAVVEAGPELSRADREFLAEVKSFACPLVVAINKIDLMPRTALIPLTIRCADLMPGAEIVPVSALTGENVAELIATVKRLLPPGPQLMAAEEATDQTERMLAEEIVREKLFFKLHQEIPVSTAVRVESFQEVPDRNLVRIAVVIIVERESHKGIVIGAGGAQLKAIGQEARLELEQLLGRRVFLQSHVRVEKNWTRDPRRLDELGL
jgi:GTP-binding protein Era